MLISTPSERQRKDKFICHAVTGVNVATMHLVISLAASDDLAAAYGIAVNGDMIITTYSAIVFHEVMEWQ